jgi:hypothetical protein
MNVTQKRKVAQAQPFVQTIKKVCKFNCLDRSLSVETLVLAKEGEQFTSNPFLNTTVINRAISTLATLA